MVTLKKRENRICQLALDLRCADCLDEINQVYGRLKDEIEFMKKDKEKRA